jgi:negative regulator of replication initiation
VARSSNGVDRREALRRIAAGAVGAAAMPLWVDSLSAHARAQAHAHAHAADAAIATQTWAPAVLTARQNEGVIALTELIIPETDTPGAKGALVNRFIDRVLSTASAAEREQFLQGLTWLDGRCRTRFGKDVAAATPDEQTALLTPLAAEGTHPAEDAPGAAIFRALKSMTISGYYTTEIGLRQELGDNGRMVLPAFEGCTHPEHQ